MLQTSQRFLAQLRPMQSAEGWDVDILSQEGFDKMHEIVRDVFASSK